MSISRLTQLLPPPEDPTDRPTLEIWKNVESELGIVFPDDYLTISQLYGSGTIVGQQTTRFGFFNPGCSNYLADLHFELKRLRDIRGPQKDEVMPFEVFPSQNGLLPLGLDDQDVWMCWQVTGQKEDWPVVVRWQAGVSGIRSFSMTLSELMVEFLQRKRELPCWPSPMFVDNICFVN